MKKKLVALAAAVAKAVCEKMGWNLDLQAIDWDAKDALIGSGTINCIWNGFTMENRENDYTSLSRTCTTSRWWS